MVFGNLTARFRQSATALFLIGCATTPAATVSPVRGASTSSGRSTRINPAEPVLPESAGAIAQPRVPEKPPPFLELDGFEPSVLRLSPDRRPSPLFVIAHGAGGQAEWHCRHYESMLGPMAALLCISGKRMVSRDASRGFYYPNHLELGRELVVARATMSSSYGRDIRGTGAVYIGYSQGATMGALALAEQGEDWPLMALVEGGYDSWPAPLARKYAKSGGKRILFVCGTDHCHRLAATSVSALVAAGVEARELYARGAGHRPDGPVAVRVREGLSWLLSGHEGFEEILEHLKNQP